MRSRILYTIFVLFAAHAGAQQDSTAFTVDDHMADGVYITYADFRTNQPVTKEQINSTIDKEQLNFIEKTLLHDKFSYVYGGVPHSIDSKTVWGFFQNNTLYVNYSGEFYRVPVFGSISYLVATVLVRNPASYGGGFGYGMGMGMGMGMGPTYTRETHEFIMDFYTGVMMELSMERAEALFSRDKAIYDEFKALSHRKRKDQLYRFIRRYNGYHPVYFLKGN